MALGIPDETVGERVGLVIVPQEGADLGENPRRTMHEFFTSKKLAEFKIPERVQVLQELPTTNVGKISRRELRAKLSGDFRLGTFWLCRLRPVSLRDFERSRPTLKRRKCPHRDPAPHPGEVHCRARFPAGRLDDPTTELFSLGLDSMGSFALLDDLAAEGAVIEFTELVENPTVEFPPPAWAKRYRTPSACPAGLAGGCPGCSAFAVLLSAVPADFS